MNLRRTWIAAVVGYSALRAVLAWGLFRDYGVNPWIFGIIDVGTAVPYATAIADLTNSIVRSATVAALKHAAIAVVTFVAPYAYIWFAAEDAPTDLRGGLAVLAICLFLAAVVGLVRKTRIARLDLANAPATQQ